MRGGVLRKERGRRKQPAGQLLVDRHLPPRHPPDPFRHDGGVGARPRVVGTEDDGLLRDLHRGEHLSRDVARVDVPRVGHDDPFGPDLFPDVPGVEADRAVQLPRRPRVEMTRHCRIPVHTIFYTTGDPFRSQIPD